MEHFCVDKKTDATGTHRVHRFSCEFLAARDDRHDVGAHPDSYSAVIAARRYYFSCEGCEQCCPECSGTSRQWPRSNAR